MQQEAELLFKFREHLKVLNRSEATITYYHDNLKPFLATLPVTDIRQVTRSMIADHIAGLYAHRTRKGTPYRTPTICIKVRSIKRFFEFLEQANLIFIDPAATIKEPPREKRLPGKVLSREETLKVLDQPNLGTLLGIRDRAILETFDSTGIRLNELCGLTIYDADLTGRMLRINKGKGGKDRVVPLGKHAARFLKEYIARVRPHYTRKQRTERHLFVDKHGKGMNRQAISVMVKKYGRAARMERAVSPHLFRHGFATALIQNGADIFAVQKMMGHEDPKTTQIYIRSLGLELKAVHRKTHPREKDKVPEAGAKPRIERIRPHDK